MRIEDYYLDLFHGIGGFALGAYWAGMKFDKHYCSDNNKYCQKLYKLRFPDSIQLGDITKIDFKKLPVGNWIITGGFPCQDISVAGKGEGIEGKRSGLWFEMWRAIRILQPRFTIIENVGAITRRGLSTVLSCLAQIGYDAEWQDIRASDMGAPHRRERIWIMAYPNGIRLNENCIQKRKSFKINWISRKYSNTINKTFRKISSSDFTGKAYGIPQELDRLEGLGNSIVPQIAEILFAQAFFEANI